MTLPIRKAPHELVIGDKLYGYTCLTDARVMFSGAVEVTVQYDEDGGVGTKEWTARTAPTTSLIIDGRVAEQ